MDGVRNTAVTPYISEWSKDSSGDSWSGCDKVPEGEHFFGGYPSLVSTAIAYGTLGSKTMRWAIALLNI